MTRNDLFEMKQQVFVGASVIVAGCRQQVPPAAIFTPGWGKQTSLFISLLVVFLNSIQLPLVSWGKKSQDHVLMSRRMFRYVLIALLGFLWFLAVLITQYFYRLFFSSGIIYNCLIHHYLPLSPLRILHTKSGAKKAPFSDVRFLFLFFFVSRRRNHLLIYSSKK